MKQFQPLLKVVLLLLAFAVPAVAGKPIITINPFTPEVLPAADFCGTFDLYLAPQPGRPNSAKIIEFANFEILSGPVLVTITNLSTSKTINLNISGPGMYSFTSNIFMGVGPYIVFGAEAQSLGLPPLAFTHGRLVFEYDDQGNITSATFTGTAQDVCQLLQ